MVTVRIAAKGSLFIARAAGERLRRWLEAQIAGSDDDVVVLDLQSVKAFDHPAADEAFAKLLITLRSGLDEPRCVAFAGATEAQVEHLDAVLDRRDICAPVIERGRLRLIGHVPAGVAAVFDLALAHGEVRAAHLGELLGVTTNAASNRLRLLWAAGILRRREVFDKLGGRAYVYELPAIAASRRAPRVTPARRSSSPPPAPRAARR